MELSRNNTTIKDFKNLLELCKTHKDKVNNAVVNGNIFFFPEGKYSCNLDKFPVVKHDPDAFYSPIICTASGNNYVMVKACGDDFVLEQFTSVTALLIFLHDYYKNVRILDASFDGDNSEYLVLFNGILSN